MIRRMTTAAVLILLLAMNVYYIQRAMDFTRVYPFGRLLYGNRLLVRVTTYPMPWEHGSRIVEVNGVPADMKNCPALLSAASGRELLSVSVVSRDQRFPGEFNIESRNKSMLWLLLFFIMCGNVHFFWGFLVRRMHPQRYLAWLFVLFSMGFCLFHFSLVEIFTYRQFQPLFIASVIFLGTTGVIIGFNLTGRRTSRMALAALSVFTVMIAAAAVLRNGWYSGLGLPRTLMIFLAICSIFAISMLVHSMITDRNIYILQRNTTIVLCMAAGCLVPVLFMILILYGDFGIPLALPSSMTLIIPLVIGNRLVENDLFNVKAYLGRGVFIVVLNAAIALVGSFFLFYIATIRLSPYALALYYAGFAGVVLYMIDVKHFFSARFSNALFRMKDYYVHSLQNIAELVSSPADLSAKLNRIYEEVGKLTGTSTLKLVLFSEPPEGGYDSFRSFVEYAGRDSELQGFFKDSMNVMLRYTLIRKKADEDAALRYMSERNIIMIVPLVRSRDLKGAILIGEKTDGDFYTDEELHYLQMVSMQLHQLVENDRLFANYIARRSFEKELDIASFIQTRLLPKTAPEKRGLDIHFFYRPYIKVTGDYFDFIPVDASRTALVIGDISGHGLSASMILSMTSSIVGVMLKEKKSLEKTVEEINHFLTYRYHGVDLISLFIGLYNRKTGELEYINAGHCAPLLFRAGRREFIPLEGRSKILGADPEAIFFTSKSALARDDELILYTDGLIEIYDEKSEALFNEKMLSDLLGANRDRSVQEKIEAVRERLGELSAEVIKDDITIIGIRIL